MRFLVLAEKQKRPGQREKPKANWLRGGKAVAA